jgi:hypothetical protein
LSSAGNSNCRRSLKGSFEPGTLDSSTTGKIAVSTGSAVVVGSGTAWTSRIIGKQLRVKQANDYESYAIMALLAPDRLVLSRAYSGIANASADYAIVASDHFAELHDQLACLLENPANMRLAIAPPALEAGVVADGQFLKAFPGSTSVQGFGTSWTTGFVGCQIEIGPKWSTPYGSFVDDVSKYRIVAVNTASQVITLDQPFSGFACKANYRVLSPPSGDSSTGDLRFKPLDILELAALTPDYAQVLGLYWIDAAAIRGAEYEYMVLADHSGQFNLKVAEGLAWLNSAPNFAGPIDGSAIRIVHAGSAPLAAPTRMALHRLPTGGARISLATPDRADSDTGISVYEVDDWSSPTRPSAQRPIMLQLWRFFRGTDASTLLPVPAGTTGHTDLGLLLPRKIEVDFDKLPVGWPPEPIHEMDGDLDVGWYTYTANAIDMWGRWSARSAPMPWTDPVTSQAKDAIHLEDLIPPPPPAAVQAFVLDDRDPYLLQDDAYTKWRGKLPAFDKGKPISTPSETDPAKINTPLIGLRVEWTWPWTHRNQGADLREFRIYGQSRPLNARPGSITSVTAATVPAESLVVLTLGQEYPSDTSPVGAFKDCALQTGNRSFPILKSQSNGATIALTVQNLGPNKTERPAATEEAAIVIPKEKSGLFKDLGDPANWETWIAAVSRDGDHVTDDIEPLFDETIPEESKATWDGTRLHLNSFAGAIDLSKVQIAIDVVTLEQTEPVTDFLVLEIASLDTSARTIVPQDGRRLQENIQYKWRVGPTRPAVAGQSAVWTKASRTLVLDGYADLGGVRPEAQLIYLEVSSASTPSDLASYFPIESINPSTRTVVLRDTVGVQALPASAAWRWKIGMPVRRYRVFLPLAPTGSNNSKIAMNPNFKVRELVPASLIKPVAYAAVAISSADWRDEIPDWLSSRPARKGNEGRLSGPATVFRVHRDPPPIPTYNWGVTRLFATRPDYHDNSFFTVRWNKPTDGPYSAHILRAMDNSLFLAHWNSEVEILPPANVPNDVLQLIKSFLGKFDTRRTQYDSCLKTWSDERAAAGAARQAGNEALAKHHDLEAQKNQELAQGEYQAAVELYTSLDDATLAWLAGRAELENAYTQVTIDPLKLSSHPDHLGPNDDAVFAPDPTNVCAYVDTLPGRSTNRYFYRVVLLDEAQNRSAVGNTTPPVHIPKVVRLTAPKITKVEGGERRVALRWTSNRQPDLAGYRVYRAGREDDARDLRSMDLVATLLVGPNGVDLEAPTVEWIDHDLPGGRYFFYRVVAFDILFNDSEPCASLAARTVDTAKPDPPSLEEPVWVLVNSLDGTSTTWPSDSVIPPGYKPAIRIRWTSTTDALTFLLTRTELPGLAETPVALDILQETGSHSFMIDDQDVFPFRTYLFRISAISATGVRSNSLSQFVGQPG